MTRYWGIAIGEGGRYVKQAQAGSYVAIGWNALDDLQWLADKNADAGALYARFKSLYAQAYPDSPIQVGIGSGQVWRFVREMDDGDVVLARDSQARNVLIATISGPCEYVPAPSDGCPYRYRRTVQWMKVLGRGELKPALKASMNFRTTLISLDHRRSYIEELIGEPKDEEIILVTGPALPGAILTKLKDGLEPHEFQKVVASVLRAIGFEEVEVGPPGPDGGFDVSGVVNASGLASVLLKVQVKKKRGTVGRPVVQNLRGTLAHDEQGAIVTTGGFTNGAQENATASGMKPISIIDGYDLVDMILSHYDELDKNLQEFLGLEKKEVLLRDRFVMRRQAAL